MKNQSAADPEDTVSDSGRCRGITAGLPCSDIPLYMSSAVRNGFGLGDLQA